MMIRRYSELRQIDTFEERFQYLRLSGGVGVETFGFDRWINQRFYTSAEWKHIRNEVIVRDLGCDLGVEGYEILDRILIHHMNPIQVRDFQVGNSSILDPEFLITTTHMTHNDIHYGRDPSPRAKVVFRAPGDTKLW